jgi:hypothetical protein
LTKLLLLLQELLLLLHLSMRLLRQLLLTIRGWQLSSLLLLPR